MSIEYCKISLKKLTGMEKIVGYDSKEFKILFGGTKVSPRLSFSRSQFFTGSKQYSKGMSISGVQEKFSLKENERHELDVTAVGGAYILKPSPEAFPHAAESEHAAMQVSRQLGIDTAQCGLVSFQGGELAYITKRFDRQSNGTKLHQEDLVQCFDMPSEGKYSKTYEEAGKLIHEVTNGKQAVVLDFVRRVILAYVIGNDDLHLKNVSVQRLPENTGQYYDRLTPNYDFLFCDAFKDKQEGMGFLALGLLLDQETGGEHFTEMYTNYGYYTGYDFLELAHRLGLQQKPIRTFIKKLADGNSKINDLIDHSFMPADMKRRAIDLVKLRIKAMQVLE